MKKSGRAGFAAVETVLVIIIIGILGFTTWFVWHSKQEADKTLSDTAKSTPATSQKQQPAVTDFATCKAAVGSKILTTYPEQCVTKAGKTFTDTGTSLLKLKNSGLTVTYDSADWKVDSNSAQSDPECGLMDDAEMSYQKGANIVLTFGLGSCGKGGASCYDTLPASCTTLTKVIATVALGSGQTAYVVANKISFTGDNPQYELWLTNEKDCRGQICGINVPNFTSNPGTIEAHAEGEGTLPGDPQTLDDFLNMPATKSAIDILKSAHF